MVEHNLAKVGVASSNLVSRSIFIFLVLLLPLLSKESITLKSYYCIKNGSLSAKDIYKKLPRKTIFKIPQNLPNFKVPSIKLIDLIRDITDLEVKDKTNGIVTIDTQCFIDYKKDKIINEIKKNLIAKYKNISIKNIFIKPVNSFPKDFSDFSYKGIKVTKQTFKKNRGNFIVVYQKENGKKLRIFFRYEVDAKILLFKAKNNITNGKILSPFDIEKEWVDFKKIPPNFIKEFKGGRFVSKNYIKKGEVIASYMLKKRTLVRKNEIVKAVINEGGVEVDFFAKALNDADLNEIVKLRGNNGKIYRGKVVKEGVAQIQ